MNRIHTLIKTILILALGFNLCSSAPAATKTEFLSPASVFEKNDPAQIKMRIMTRSQMIRHILIEAQINVHTAQYTPFTDNPVTTGGGANCTALVFINQTKKTWAIWHYPLIVAAGNIENYILGNAEDQGILYNLPIAFASLYEDLHTTDDTALYIFGGGSNRAGDQKRINNEVNNFFTKAGIDKIYDMTPHDAHGRGPILDQVIIARGNAFDKNSDESIVMKYFYGGPELEFESESLEVYPRLIGGTSFRKVLKDTTYAFTQSA